MVLLRDKAKWRIAFETYEEPHGWLLGEHITHGTFTEAVQRAAKMDRDERCEILSIEKVA